MNLGRVLGRWREMDLLITLSTLLLLVFGLVFVFSAGRSSGTSLFQRQFAWSLLGMGIYLAVPLVDYDRVVQWAGWIYVGGIVLLAAVLVGGIEAYGAKRWLRLGPAQLQPAELMKLILILALARYLGAWRRDWRTLRTPVVACLLAGIPFVLIARQPDLGTAAVLIPITAAMLWLGGLRMRHLLLGTALVALAAAPAVAQLAHYQSVYLPARDAGQAVQAPFWYMLKPYQCDRLLVFLDPARDPLNTGWSLMQSRIAIGSGGWVGKGWLQGTQNVLGFLPRTVAPTDFIFSVVAEETGFVGALILIGLYGILLTSGARVAAGARDQNGRLIAAGVCILVFCHVYVNIGMTVGLVPVTGLPLPLISYGGSFLVSTLAGIGLVQSVYIRRRET